MQKPFANSVSQALLYRFTELGYKFLESPEGKSYITVGTGLKALPNKIEAHYEFLRNNHENEGLDSVIEQFCFALLEDKGVTYQKNEKYPFTLPMYILEMKNDNISNNLFTAVFWLGAMQVPVASLPELLKFCLWVENEA